MSAATRSAPDDPYRLDNLVAVVTGAAQGLGLGIAEQLARHGAAVIMADRQVDKARLEASRLQEQGLNIQAVGLDITDSAGVTAFFQQIASEHGRLDILVTYSFI